MSSQQADPVYDPYVPHRFTTPSKNYSSNKVSYRRDLAESILDSTFTCQIAYHDPEDKVVRIVTRQYGRSREGDSLYLHGAGLPLDHDFELPPEELHTSRLYRLVALGKVRDVTLNVSIVDALLPAQSAINAALSYRSVVIFGKASVVEEGGADGEKCRALNTITEHIIPGYAARSRKANEQELDEVGIIRVDFEHVSAKMRNSGPPIETGLPHWADTIPVRQVYGPPITAGHLKNQVPVPDYVATLTGVRGTHNVVTDQPKYDVVSERTPGAPAF